MTNVNQTIEIESDANIIAIHDEALSNHLSNNEVDLNTANVSDFPEVETGKVTLFSAKVEFNNRHILRITTGSLSEIETSYASDVNKQAGFEVSSGSICIYSGEHYLSGSYGNRSNKLSLKNGQYDLEIYQINAYKADLDHEVLLPDYVVILNSRKEKFKKLTEFPQFYDTCTFLYPSNMRKKYTIELGIVLPGMVESLKDHVPEIAQPIFQDRYLVHDVANMWPEGFSLYSIHLVNTSELKNMDSIKFKIISVDHKEMVINGEVVEIYKPENSFIKKILNRIHNIFFK